MADGIEVVLGWKVKDFAEAAKAFGIELPVYKDRQLLVPEEWRRTPFENEEPPPEGEEEYVPCPDDEDYGERLDDFITEQTNKVASKVAEAHRELLTASGFEHLGFVDGDEHYPVYKTPWGQRRFSTFTAEMFYDPTNMGHKPRDAVFGVALSSRYFPAFLDAESEHGTLDAVILDEDMLSRITLAKSILSKYFPGFSTTTTMVLHRFY